MQISDSVSKLYRKSEFYKKQREHTDKAIKQLEKSIDDDKLHEFYKKPTIFLATSSGRDVDHVVGVIKSVIDEYSTKFNLLFWSDINKSGDINEQILKAISKCKYGICYFSEKDTTQDSYCDSFNVTFEAGMMHALTNNKVENAPEAWIPIREMNSPKIPFDFAAQRILAVPRNNDTLNEEDFKTQLRSRIEEL
jgi:hypothetical protein